MNPIRGLITILNGIMSALFSDYGANNPEVMYRGILDAKLKERAKLMSAAGVVMGSRNERRSQKATAERELADVNRRLAGALRDKQVEVGGLLLQKKTVLEKQIADLVPQVQQLDQSAENITHDIGQFNAQIIALKQEATVNTARMRSAKAQKKIMDMVAGLSVDTNDQMLQDLRQRIEAEVGEVQVRQEIDQVGNIERKLSRAEAATETSGFQAEFEAMIQQQEAAQGTHAAQAPPADGGGKQV